MEEKNFKVQSKYQPAGDQVKAIAELVKGFEEGKNYQTLLGVTGSGKTFTMANVIEKLNKPTLVIAHNKTLAAQLCSEFKEFFPDNAVEYFVSYYDYYQPEAYVPSSDTFIEKDSSINEEIEKLRHSATSALFERNDVIIVASVSCIYGLGSPEEYKKQRLSLRKGQLIERDAILRKLVDIQYERNNLVLDRGSFRVRGDIIEIIPASINEKSIRIEMFGDEVDRILEVDILTGEIVGERSHIAVFPATHYVTAPEYLDTAIENIEKELEERIKYFEENNRLIEAQRIRERTKYDVEMLKEIGFCSGVENYSRHLTGRPAGENPYTLIDYFPEDFLIFIDESHMTIPQIGGMYEGDRSRKSNLVDYGFRLPSALDNRPLKFHEFEEKMKKALFVSATPGPYEEQHAQAVVEQIIRPTGLIDPKVEVRPIKGQIDDLIHEIKKRVEDKERVLVTTLTKKMAEDLTDYLSNAQLKVRYLHSEVKTIERMEIIRDLRLGEFDVLVGINLLREGLDLPEVSLVAILDADKEGFLRSERALIQTIGRAARNIKGTVIMYADQMTKSMDRAISETERRRKIQKEYNRVHNIDPQSIVKEVYKVLEATQEYKGQEEKEDKKVKFKDDKALKKLTDKQREKYIRDLEKEMFDASKKLEFERAALIRDLIIEARNK